MLFTEITQNLAASIVSFIVGIVVGFVFGYFIGKKTGVRPVGVVNIIIVVLWTASVTMDVVNSDDSSTPFFLHALMGSVMGYLNPTFGNYLLQLFGKGK